MSGARFLVSLWEQNTSEKKIMLTNVPKQNLNILVEDAYSPETEVSETDSKFNGEISNLSTELLEIKFNGDKKKWHLWSQVILRKNWAKENCVLYVKWKWLQIK